MSLTSIERRWLCSIFATILPTSEADLSPSATDLPMERFVADLNRSAPSDFNLGLRVALWVVMLSPPFMLGRLHTFAGLSADERLAVLRRLAASEIYLLREVPLLLKMIGCLGYCGAPEVQSRLGIPLSNPAVPAWLGARADKETAGARQFDTERADL
jgi:hypothetical protein